MALNYMVIQLETTNLPAPMSDALEHVRRGEEVTIADHGHAIAKLVPVISLDRVFGDFQGKIHLSDDFTAALTEVELAEWEK